MVSSKYFDLSPSLKHNVDNGIDVLRFLAFLSHLSKYRIPADGFAYLEPFLDRFAFFAFITHQAHLVGVHEVVSVREIDLLVLQLDPHHFFDQLVPPSLHDFQRGVQLTVEDPQEDKPFISQQMERNPANLAISHSVIL